jgi:hypothetical protein
MTDDIDPAELITRILSGADLSAEGYHAEHFEGDPDWPRPNEDDLRRSNVMELARRQRMLLPALIAAPAETKAEVESILNGELEARSNRWPGDGPRVYLPEEQLVDLAHMAAAIARAVRVIARGCPDPGAVTEHLTESEEPELGKVDLADVRGALDRNSEAIIETARQLG